MLVLVLCAMLWKQVPYCAFVNCRLFHVVYNSLCGYASVNHLHLHSFYAEHVLYAQRSTLALVPIDIDTCNSAPESASTRGSGAGAGCVCIRCFELADGRVPGFVFEWHERAECAHCAARGGGSARFVALVLAAMDCLFEMRVAHNLALTRVVHADATLVVPSSDKCFEQQSTVSSSSSSSFCSSTHNQ